MTRRRTQEDEMFDDEQAVEKMLRSAGRAMTLVEVVTGSGLPQGRAVGALERLCASGGAYGAKGGGYRSTRSA